jgi:hypothetical protein
LRSPCSRAFPARSAYHGRAPQVPNPGGAIVEGLYRVEGDSVEVTDMDGRLLGRAPIKPGDDPEVTERRILREKRAASGFYDPIPYRSVH